MSTIGHERRYVYSHLLPDSPHARRYRHAITVVLVLLASDNVVAAVPAAARRSSPPPPSPGPPGRPVPLVLVDLVQDEDGREHEAHAQVADGQGEDAQRLEGGRVQVRADGAGGVPVPVPVSGVAVAVAVAAG
ncbi:hypothetical protein F5X96DRAFT_672746 [Biscogniauxia mediterranea]|nr:hypothetical protein F5X96DRAFT_672746 [Biscogniauxia mediterranea]